MSETRTRILYIDDDQALGRLVQRDLRRHGYEVVLAASGPEGEVLAGPGFAVICVDHYMPGMDGMQTLARLRGKPDMPPIVYVTGSEEGRLAVAALRAGAADYVIKETGNEFLHLLRAALESAIGREALRREKERADAAMRAALARAEELASQRQALLQEVNHRVANSLQLIAALTQLQEASVTDAAARSALAEVRNRVHAVAQVHRRLYTSDDVRIVALDDYLRGLVEEIRRSLERGHRFVFALSLQPMTVATDTAVSVGVVLAELVTNAVKYAYPEEEGGPIRVTLTREDASGVLAVEDDGRGAQLGPEAGAVGSGVGQKIIQAIASGIRGRIDRDVRAFGTSVRFSFPLGL